MERAKSSTTGTVLTTMKLEGSSGHALRQCIAATRRGGVVSIPGVYAGFIHAFLIGNAFDKGLTFRMGQTHVQRFMPELLQMIQKDGSPRKPSSPAGCRWATPRAVTRCSTRSGRIAARSC